MIIYTVRGGSASSPSKWKWVEALRETQLVCFQDNYRSSWTDVCLNTRFGLRTPTGRTRQAKGKRRMTRSPSRRP